MVLFGQFVEPGGLVAEIDLWRKGKLRELGIDDLNAMRAGCAAFIQNHIPDAIYLRTAIEEEIRRKESQEAEERNEQRHQALLSEQQRISEKTWLQRKIEWFENHRYLGPALLIVFIMSFVGGIINFGTTLVDVSKRVFFSEASGWPITLSLQNLQSAPIEVGPLCRIELIENRMAGWASYSGSGDVARLSPANSVVGTNAYIIPLLLFGSPPSTAKDPHEHREFKIAVAATLMNTPGSI